MKIIDKAVWQIDGGVPADKVEAHFRTVFAWLGAHGMLTGDGEEELEDGIDDCASLNDELLNERGMDFLESCYDDYLKAVGSCYGQDADGRLLGEIYARYEQTLADTQLSRR